MDYDKFSESTDATSSLADRLNSSLTTCSSESGPEDVKESPIAQTKSDSDNTEPSVVENESNNSIPNPDTVKHDTKEAKLDSNQDKKSDDDNNQCMDNSSLGAMLNLGNMSECNITESLKPNNYEDNAEPIGDSDAEYLSEDSGSEVEYESADEGEEFQTDQQNLQNLEDQLTDEQKEEKRKEAQTLKEEGNDLFRGGSYKSAIRTYSRALRTCPLKFPKDRSIMYSNRAACKMHLEDFESSIQDCSKALDLHPQYMKALMRRAELYEKTDKLDEALNDYQKIVELDPSQHSARAACMRLPDVIKERNEKLKEEMMGKLKDLGNMVLRPFGLSTNNFQLNQDPNSGGYSVNFVQNPQQNS
ncbi:cytochrome c oxidase subunit 1 [Mactra antiquata]